MPSEEEQVAVIESSPEPTTQPVSVPKKPKRLTLQERLAAAAKAKRKKAEDTSSPAPEKTPEIAESTPEAELEEPKNTLAALNGENSETGEKNDEKTVPEPEKPSTEVLDVSEPEKELSKEPEQVTDGKLEEPEEKPVSIEAEKVQIDTSIHDREETPPTKTPVDAKDAEIERLKSEVELLKTKLNDQKKEPMPLVRRVPQNKDTEKKLAEKEKLLTQCEKKLAEKENTIQQLMEEGQELSKKELKLNERIRLLVANNTKLESSLKSYAEKNEESLLKLSEIEDLVKNHKLKSVDQLFEVLAAANQKIADLQAALDKQKDSNWEGKYKEVQRLYERELDEKKECKKELSETHVQLELLQNQSRLELQSKTDIIEQLNREMMSSKDESSTEVLRLEAKIESLRMENENFLKTQNPGANGSENNSQMGKKLVDYVDFLKLSDTHQNLQAQYVSSQENWKLIESNLLNKVETLTASVEILKKAKLKSSAEVKKLHSKLNSQLDEIESLKTQLANALEERKEQEFRIEMKKNEYNELEEKLEELKTVFSSDRKNYDVKIKTLTETIHNLENQTPNFTPSMSFDNISSLQGRRGTREGGLHISMDQRLPMQRKFSTQSIASSAMNTPAHAWEEASFISEGPENQIYDNHNTSSFSFNEDIYPFDAPEPGETPLNSHLSSAGAGATKHIQIINKMSASIRRLEAEILTLKEENEQLATEKEYAQREIVDRNELDKKLRELEQRISSLQSELEEKSRREGTLLEVIGEKSEKVGELEADVYDLKDLLRQQVQQMIEMQNK